jgi:hypothetical protein
VEKHQPTGVATVRMASLPGLIAGFDYDFTKNNEETPLADVSIK